MEQNLVSDEELLERINKVLHESKQDRKEAEVQRDTSGEKFHDVIESSEPESIEEKGSEVTTLGAQKNLVLENHYLSLQLQAEKKKAKELQSKFKLFENSVKYFERLNGQLETIKQAVNEDIDSEFAQYTEAMQKIRPKNIHTAGSAVMSPNGVDDTSNEAPHSGEPNNEESKGAKDDKEEVAFRDAEDFKQLDQGLEILKDKPGDVDSQAEKVFITKTERRCLEDIGSLAARTRAPLDDKHQKYFERDRRRFANSIVMPETQEVEKSDTVPAEIISKTKETPVNITSTELDGLRSYLLQLKELIARRETAWARTTERDYNQRVEITRFKNEVSHLRMLCEKRQKDIIERDQMIAAKDEEIKELQKRVKGLRNAIMKIEKKDEKLIDTLDGMTNEVLENSHLVQKSYNAMKRQSMINRATISSNLSLSVKQPANVTSAKSITSQKDQNKNKKYVTEKPSFRKVKPTGSFITEDDCKAFGDKKQRSSTREKPKTRHKNESLSKTKETYEKVDEKLQRVEEMLHNEVFKGRKSIMPGGMNKNAADIKSLIKNHLNDKNTPDFNSIKKLTPSNSTIRQEMLTAMTGLGSNMSSNVSLRPGSFLDPKKNQPTAAIIANALVAARNANMFTY